MSTEDLSISYVVQAQPAVLFLEIARAEKSLNNRESTIQYLTIALQLDKYKLSTLSKYLSVMREYGASDDELLSLLGQLYDYTNPDDQAFLLRAAGAAGDECLFNAIKARIRV